MDDYIKALEEERKKISVFERELPLSLELITQAIETYKKHKFEVGEEINYGEEGPVLEEFIPLRPSCSSSDDENHNHNNNNNVKINSGINGDGVDKPDWLKSVQLWNQQPEQTQGDDVRKPIAMSTKRMGGAFHPFERAKVVNVAPTSSASNDNTNTGKSGEEKEKEGHSQRKARRCWSTELHRRFLNALQQLGGPHVATPKLIRELMKVDGLTNDEVKSHLQKYRLHNKWPATNPAAQASSNSSPHQPPQIVLVGGTWVPVLHQHTTDAALNAACAPVPSLPSEISSQKLRHHGKQKINRSPTSPLNSDRRRGDDDKGNDDHESMNSHSSNTSSSTSQTTNASLASVN